MKTLPWLSILCFAASPEAAAPPVAYAPLLVRRLGADSFEERERADRLLFSQGKASVPALRQGAKHRDAEIRRRCVRLLARIERVALEPRLEALLDGEDTFAPPLPGWEAFREVVGKDAAARSLYVELYREDRIALEWVQGGNVGASAGPRAETLRTRMDAAQARKGEAPSAGRLAGVLLLATLSTGDDRLGHSAVNGLFSQRATAAHVAADPAVRRLAVQFFARQGVDPDRLVLSAYLTRSLELEDVRNDTLKPAALRALESALVPTPDLAKLSQAATAIQMLEIEDGVPARARKALRKIAEGVAAKPFKSEDTFAILSALLTLRMQATAKEVFEPQALALARGLAGEKFERSRLDEIHQFCQILESSEGVEAAEAAACARLAELTSAGAGVDALSDALLIAGSIELGEAREGLVVPAIRKKLVAALENPEDWAGLMAVCRLAAQANLERAGELVTPALRRRAQALASKPIGIVPVAQVYQVARSLQATEAVAGAVELALRRALDAALTQDVEESAVAKGLTLARDLRLKEGAELGVKAASNRKYSARTRGNAVATVGRLGTPEQAGRLAPLLDDATSLGASFDGTDIRKAQVRDLVLAALVVGAKQSLGEYGFGKRARFSGNGRLSALGYFGFRSDEERNAALARWKKWSAGQKK